jgi:hypothetical protein
MKRFSQLFREAVNDIIQRAYGVFMILTQAGSQWGRALVDVCAVVAIDEVAAALDEEIFPAWKGDMPCILAGDEAQ